MSVSLTAKSIALFVPLLLVGAAIVPSASASQSGSASATDWFANTKEAVSFYRKSIHRFRERTHSPEDGLPPETEAERTRDGFTDVAKRFRANESAFLAPLRTSGPLCEEKILSSWQTLLKGLPLETFLYYLRDQDRVDDLVLRALLRVYSALETHGAFPELASISFPAGALPLSPRLTALLEADPEHRGIDARGDDKALIDLHFEGCVSKVVRGHVRAMGNPKAQEAGARDFYLRLAQIANVDAPEAVPALSHFSDLDLRDRKELVSTDTASLDSIRAVAIGISWNFGAMSPTKVIRDDALLPNADERTRGQTRGTPYRSAYFALPATDPNYSQRQWIYELSARTGDSDLIDRQSRTLTKFSTLTNPENVGNFSVVTRAGRSPLFDQDVSWGQLSKTIFGALLQSNQRLEQSLHTGVNFPEIMAAGIEAGNLRSDEDVGSYFVMYLNEINHDPRAVPQDAFVQSLLRYGPTVSLFSGPYSTGIAAMITAVRTLVASPAQSARLARRLARRQKIDSSFGGKLP